MSGSASSSGLAALSTSRGGRGRRRGHHGPVGHSGGLGKPLVGLVVVCAIVFGVVQVLRSAPSPTVRTDQTVLTTAGGHLSLPWPSQGTAAVAVDGTGLVGTSGPATTPQPIASITKLMTALVVIHAHPLGAGQPGPTITITPADVAIYQADVATQQSVIAVKAGEQLTEVQALEGLLVPSGNNMADVLADWVAGSIPAFVADMNARAAAMGLSQTHFASPSGLNPGSVSTPANLITLGEAVMANPVLASIVGMAQATLPVAGKVESYTYNLGHAGIVGIKTGASSQAGGCDLFDASDTVDGKTVQIIGVVLGQQTPSILQTALNAGTSLVQALLPQLQERTLVTAGQPVAEVTTAWGAHAAVVASRSFTTLAWPGLHAPISVAIGHLTTSLHQGQHVGTLRIDIDGTDHDIPLTMGSNLGGPSLSYKLTNV